MPPTVVSLPGVLMAGDWLAQGPGTHGAKGLSQEKAYVTGLQAGNQVRVWCPLFHAKHVCYSCMDIWYVSWTCVILVGSAWTCLVMLKLHTHVDCLLAA